MKIQDAKRLYSAKMDALWTRRQSLSQLLKDPEGRGPEAPVFDRVELSRELSKVSAQYDATREVMEGITATESAARDIETSKQQCEAAAEAAKEMGKMMEVYRRIASGGRVPPEDEKKLMEYNHELYMAAKSAAMLARQEGEEYDSLWQEEEDGGEKKTAGEIAGEKEISVPSPHTVAAGAAPAETAETA